MNNKNILIATSSFDENNIGLIHNLKKLNFKITKNSYGRKLNKQELVHLLKKNNIESVIAGLETYDDEVLSSSKLKIISRVGSGIDNIDLSSAKKNKIKIFSTPSAPVDAVAELTIASMISLLRNLTGMSNNMKKKVWKRESGSLLKNKHLAIIGYGKIGKRVHQLLRPFRVNVIIVDPKVSKTNKHKEIFSKAIRKADIITFHTNSSKYLISLNNIKAVKKGVILLNASRGSVIEEKALIYGLKNKIINSVWLDVFSEEPYFGKLCKSKNALLTPHCGSFTKETRILMEKESIQNLLKNYL